MAVTNLALQLGHRKSIDLDLFISHDFDALELDKYLVQQYKFITKTVRGRGTVMGDINGVKIDMIAHLYPWLTPPFTESGVRMVSLADVASMKLIAIADNGKRLKDFVDVAYLSTQMSLADMLQAYETKYASVNSSSIMIVRGLSYFKDIDFDVEIDLANSKKFDWEKIRERILAMIKYENKIFETEPI